MNQKQIVRLCGGLALLVVVGVFLGGVFIMYLQYKYTYIYATIQGEIIETSVSTDQIQSAKIRPIAVTPHLVYKYFINEKEYTGNRINIYKSFTYSGTSDSSAIKSTDKFRSLYPIGSKVSVHYNPKDPSDAIIEPGFDIIGIGVTTFGLLMIIGAGFIIKKKSV